MKRKFYMFYCVFSQMEKTSWGLLLQLLYTIRVKFLFVLKRLYHVKNLTKYYIKALQSFVELRSFSNENLLRYLHDFKFCTRPKDSKLTLKAEKQLCLSHFKLFRGYAPHQV